MRILHVAPSIGMSYGGPTESLIRYSDAAGKAGVEVTVAAPATSADDSRAFIEKFGTRNLVTFSSFGSGAFRVSPKMVHWVHENARRFDAVHVHGLFNPISTLSSRAVISARIPLILRPFGTLSHYTFVHRRSLLKKAYFLMLEQDNVRRAAALHFTSEVERDEAERHGLAIAARSHVIPPPCELENPPVRKHTEQSAAPHVLFLSRLNPVKNVEALLAAWPLVLEHEPAARLRVAGPGTESYRLSLVRRAARLGVAASVTFSGFAAGNEKADLFASSDVFVLPSRHENFGMAVLEAMAAGLPVVISPEVQLAGFVRTSKLGKIAESQPRELAMAIVDTIRSDELRRHASDEGYRLVSQAFSPGIVGRKLLAMYESAAAAHRQAIRVER